ncbi:MAG: glycosyltransferase, partial [Blastocatellia bacterium]|nr:glycosyltransferase [Blastocatellia bacterium]
MQKQVSTRLAWAVTVLFLGTGTILGVLSFYFYESSVLIFLSLFLAYLLHGLTFSLVMLVLSYLGLKKKNQRLNKSKQKLLTVTVAVPVFNESEVITTCIDSILKQTLKAYEIIIINDESTDDTLAKLIKTYALKPIKSTSIGKIKTARINNVYQSTTIANLQVIDKQHRGKADALNSALNICQGEVFLTIDADSFLHRNAMEKLVAAIDTDDLVVGAGGTVKAANGIDAQILASEKGALPKGLLPKIQWIEYATGFVWRFGWGFLNTLLLISGSFGAFRTEVLRKCQGFDPDSITEDYEMVYRLHHYHLSNKIPYRLVTVADALVYTLVPDTVFGLVKQRIRWFQGFLQTLFHYRNLVFNQNYG